MSTATVVTLVPERCTACALCILTCPARALAPAPRHPRLVPGRCDGCGDCVEVCPRDALQLDDARRSP